MTTTIKIKITGYSKSAVSKVTEDLRKLYWPQVDITSPKVSDGGGYHAYVTIYLEAD